MIACAIEHDGIVASNNLSDVIFYIEKFDLGLITTSIMFALLYEKNIINLENANKLWDELNKKNRRLPTPTFTQYYEKLLKKDFIDFNCEKYYNEI